MNSTVPSPLPTFNCLIISYCVKTVDEQDQGKATQNAETASRSPQSEEQDVVWWGGVQECESKTQ